MAKQTFMVKILGMTEAEARAELLKISQEKNITPDMYDQGEMESQEGTNLEEPEDEDNEKTEESEESIPGGEK